MYSRTLLLCLFWVKSGMNDAYLKTYGQSFDTNEFKRSWCRQRRNAFDWQAILAPCESDMQYSAKPRSNKMTEGTSHQNSLLFTRVAPAGQFTHIWIESRDNLNNRKNVGGDSWRVMLRSDAATLAADVFDFNNGTYEALVLIMEPGLYELDVRLDYTLCDGLRNPPVDWFHKVHCSGKLNNQVDIGTELFSDMEDYYNKKIGNGELGETLTIRVIPSNIDLDDHAKLMVEADNECNIKCKKLWDGYGRWSIEDQWTPFMQEINLPSSTDDNWRLFEGRENFDYIGRHKKHKGIFWIYGDSLSFYFYQSFSKNQKEFCNTQFKMCNVSYNWIYPKTLYDLTETCSETKLEIPKVLHYLREVTNKPTMGENSVLVFNAGAHYVKTTSFEQYKEAISEIAKVLGEEFRGKAIWKSTSAIHDQTATVMGSFRRFTTDQRVKLFNAYSNEVMCEEGLSFVDIYPISASYPSGTEDGIHYDANVFSPLENLFVQYFIRSAV